MAEVKPPMPSLDEPTDNSGGGTHLGDRIANELELLRRKVELLERLSTGPPMGIIRLSETVNLPVHKVRYTLHLLEREGVVQPSADGAVVTDAAATYWLRLEHALDRMTEQIQFLKQRVVDHKNHPPARRKGY